VAMSVVDLALKAGFRPVLFLVFGVEINAAVRTGLRHHVHFEMKVFERLLVADIKQMTPVAMRDKCPILDFPGIRVFFCLLPAVERLAVTERGEAFLRVSSGDHRGKSGEKGAGSESKQKIAFHGADISRENPTRKAKERCFLAGAHDSVHASW